MAIWQLLVKKGCIVSKPSMLRSTLQITGVPRCNAKVYVGSTGCDEDDISCHDSNQPPSELFAYDVSWRW